MPDASACVDGLAVRDFRGRSRRVCSLLEHSMTARPNAAPTSATAKLHSLGMTVQDVAALMNKLDESDRESEAKGRKAPRKFKRRSYRIACLAVDLIAPGGATTAVTMVCRNLSSGGLAALHNSFLHPGTHVHVTLKHVSRGPTVLAAKVTHSQHLKGVVHQVGIKFDQPIKPSDYIKLDQLEDWFSLESVPPEELRGCLVVVGTSEIEQRLIQNYLQGTDVRLRCADDEKTGIAYAADGADLVIADPDQGKLDLDGFFAALNDGGVATPVVVATARSKDDRQRWLREFEPAAIVAKPLTKALFLRAVAEFLIVGRSGAATVSSMLGHDERASLLPAFVRSLNDSAVDMRGLLERRDTDSLRAMCAQIAKAAPGMGFSGVGLLAEQAGKSLAQTQSAESSRAAIQRLIVACESAQMQKKAG